MLISKKYIPNNINELLIDDSIIDLLNILKSELNMSMLLYGGEECGKTTIINTFVNDCVNSGLIKQENIFNIENYNELTFIQYIQDLKIFCNSSNTINNKKIVLIDNFENLTENNQQNIKNLIEKEKDNIIYIFATNNLNIVIESIQNNLIQINCKGLDINKVKKHVEKIIHTENIKLNEKDIKKIIINSNNSLNCIFHYCEKIKLSGIKGDLENDFFNLIDNEIFDKYFDKCKKYEIYDGYKMLDILLQKGYMIIDIYDELYEYCKRRNKKYILIELLCKYIDKFYDGHDKSIELYFMTNDIINIIKNNDYN